MRYFSNQACGFLSSGGGNLFMGLILIILAAALIYMIFKTQKKDKNTSIDILKERLAKGEISVDEFDRLKAVLK